MFDSKDTAIKIETLLNAAFNPTAFEIEDQSHRHKHHRQAGGGGHFYVTIRSARFNGLAPLARQRLVLEAVAGMMDKEIHALSMRCLPEPATPAAE
ncbi:MAG: BolA family transcriptional regulator [Proteobacteria bacterium]|nr:MAG: BolA family transcriptional regulator [Pseudomonadota bacterium]